MRGDLYINSLFDNNYAAILAIMTFYTLKGITAAFDLKAKQFDITSAFLDSKLVKNVYTIVPDGYQ